MSTPSPQPASLDAEYGELRALAARASLGAWERGPELTVVTGDGRLIARLSSTRGKFEWEACNADYIAAANPAAILSILDSRAQLVERVAVLEAALARVCTHDKRESSQINADWDNARAVLANATPHPHADEAAKVEWISVDERLPREGTPTLNYRPSYADKIVADPYWRDYQATEDGGVTHWMPLPAPPSSPAEGKPA